MYGPQTTSTSSLGNILEMQIHGPHPRLTQAEALEVSPGMCPPRVWEP